MLNKDCFANLGTFSPEFVSGENHETVQNRKRILSHHLQASGNYCKQSILQRRRESNQLSSLSGRSPAILGGLTQNEPEDFPLI